MCSTLYGRPWIRTSDCQLAQLNLTLPENLIIPLGLMLWPITLEFWSNEGVSGDKTNVRVK